MTMSGKQPGAEGDDIDASSRHESQLQEGRDYYVENGLFVFTGEFLLRRGYCCESGCRHCPFRIEN
jgi:hypothetical protein